MRAGGPVDTMYVRFVGILRDGFSTFHDTDPERVVKIEYLCLFAVSLFCFDPHNSSFLLRGYVFVRARREPGLNPV
jgi:hypothetical protein